MNEELIISLAAWYFGIGAVIASALIGGAFLAGLNPVVGKAAGFDDETVDYLEKCTNEKYLFPAALLVSVFIWPYYLIPKSWKKSGK